MFFYFLRIFQVLHINIFTDVLGITPRVTSLKKTLFTPSQSFLRDFGAQMIVNHRMFSYVWIFVENEIEQTVMERSTTSNYLICLKIILKNIKTSVHLFLKRFKEKQTILVTVRYEGMFNLCLYAVTIYDTIQHNLFSK